MHGGSGSGSDGYDESRNSCVSRHKCYAGTRDSVKAAANSGIGKVGADYWRRAAFGSAYVFGLGFELRRRRTHLAVVGPRVGTGAIRIFGRIAAFVVLRAIGIRHDCKVIEMMVVGGFEVEAIRLSLLFSGGGVTTD